MAIRPLRPLDADYFTAVKAVEPVTHADFTPDELAAIVRLARMAISAGSRSTNVLRSVVRKCGA